MCTRGLVLILVETVASVVQAAGEPEPFSPQTELVSINRFGTNSGNGDSHSSNRLPALSGNGRFVAFVSSASDLVATDTNGGSRNCPNSCGDVFVRDVQTGTTTLVSANLAGTDSGDGGSGQVGPSISRNGRFVAFMSEAHDLVANDNNDSSDVFVRDLQTRKTTLVSANRSGTNGGNDGSIDPVITSDGRFVVFVSSASDLVASDTNGRSDVFVRDLQRGTTRLVSTNLAGTDSGRGDSGLYSFAISSNGRFVAFVSDARDLTATPLTSECIHFSSDPAPLYCGDNVFVRDLQAGKTTLVSMNLAGTSTANCLSLLSALSANGRFVAFTSFASDLVATDTNEDFDLFVRDLQTGVTSLVTVNFDGTDSANIRRGQTGYPPSPAAFSADGRLVAFESSMSDLVARDTNDADDVFVRDLVTGTTTLASVNREGTDAARPPTECRPEQGGCVFRPFGSGGPTISADGLFVAFGSSASDLVGTDSNGNFDVFVRDLRARSTRLVSVNRAGSDSGNSGSFTQNISADGHVVAFVSDASDLVAADTNGRIDVFVRPAEGAITFARFEPMANIDLSPVQGKDRFEMFAAVTLGADSDGIPSVIEPVTIQVGTFSTTIPANAFQLKDGKFTFIGRIRGVKVYAQFHQIKGRN